jgi:hypothetical protein
MLLVDEQLHTLAGGGEGGMKSHDSHTSLLFELASRPYLLLAGLLLLPGVDSLPGH